MDDQTFDDETALKWIHAIESAKSSLRDQDIHPEVNSWIKRNSLNEILEIGCGQGQCSDRIDLKNRKYTGVDPSPKMLERAIELYSQENRYFVQGNVYSLPFKPESFDGAFSILVWHLLSDLDAAASELARVLKPGGDFLIVTANPEASSGWKAFYPKFELKGKRLEGTMTLGYGSPSYDVLYLHTQEELFQSFKKLSLVVQRTKTFRPNQDGLDLLVVIEGKKL